MVNKHYVHNFTRMYLEEMGYIVGVYVDDKHLHINLFENGFYATRIDIEDFLNDEEENLKECTMFLIKELEKIDKEEQ